MKIHNALSIILVSLVIVIIDIIFIFGDKEMYSESERRKLSEFPEISLSEIISGEYMTDFEKAASDNFPCRDIFRTVKAYTNKIVLGKIENNGIYTCDGHISKLDKTLNYNMLDHASECFENIYKNYFENTNANIYFSVIPDKNMFLAQKQKYPSFDYEELFSYMQTKTNYMNYIDISGFLSSDDYYNTDTHWKQESITDIAKHIAKNMNTDIYDNYSKKTVNDKFYGVYYGQSALCFKPDNLNCLTNDIIENCKVTIYPNGKAENSVMYNMEKADGKDPYEMFLSGNQPVVKIENKKKLYGKNLVIFRDSFASSLAPLLASGYSKITLIDTRYIQPSLLGNFIDSNTDDVLFIYSTLILNSSLSIN